MAKYLDSTGLTYFWNKIKKYISFFVKFGNNGQVTIGDTTKTFVEANTAITGATKTKITYDSKGLVTAGADLAESDIPSLHLSKITDVTASATEVNVLDGITATTSELNILDGVTATASEINVLDGITATTADLNKTTGIEAGAEVNQNAFSNIKVGNTTVAADAKTDTVEFVAGSNITLTPDATNDKITIAVTDTSGEANQNAFSYVKVTPASGSSTTIEADTKTDTLELKAGTNISLTPDATNDKITINVTGIANGAEVNLNAFSTVVVTGTSGGTMNAVTKLDTVTFIPGNNVSLSAIAGAHTITINATDTTYDAATADPLEDATTAAVGTSVKYAREDHKHPKDSAKADKVSGATSGHLAALDANGNLTDSGVSATSAGTDTKNTAGTDDSSDKLFLVGVTAQTASGSSNGTARTYTQDTAYVGTDGHLYSDSKLVVNLSGTQTLTNKTLTSPSLTSPTMTGTPTAPTATTGTDTTQVATTAFVNASITAASSNYIPTTAKGTANGVCPLDSTSKIDPQYLPSYVDDVVEAYARSGQTELSEDWLATGSATGTVISPQAGVIYVLMNSSTNYILNTEFRWGGTTYVKLNDAGCSELSTSEIDAATDQTPNATPYS